MNIKKTLVLVLALVAMIAMCACEKSKNKKSAQTETTKKGVSSPVVDSEPTQKTEVSIPTDSSLADSVFDDASNPTKPAGDSSAATNDTEGATDATKPIDVTDSDTEATTPDTTPDEMTYEAFTALTPEEQRLYQESFNDLEAFFEWYVAAKEKYEKENPPIEIDGPVDLGKL